ncbi:MAG TPA: YcjX family protein [Hyphomicrobium sp.]|nr:YcjX family protein [Hyphomicrobium sp.]
MNTPVSDTQLPDLLQEARSFISDYFTPSVRLGVTGLSRSGKTVFITALVRNLTGGGRLPFFVPDAEGRIARAYLEPQPDDAVPRFDYEAHMAHLESEPPRWPESTRRVSELRVTIEYQSGSTLKRLLGLSRLHLDIVDYPGEWLIDLPLLGQSYAEFSNDALTLARDPRRTARAKPLLDFLAGTAPAGVADETVALHGAQLFTTYLRACRESETQSTLAPGRFLMPGDLDGSPLLTFFPMPLTAQSAPPRGSLAAMMMRRYESYKTEVVRPFFKDHFSRIDRQIVLVDVLGALGRGANAVRDLDRAMEGVLKAFRPGANSWLSMLMGRRIEKVLFAATKADHLPASSHDRLAAILQVIVEQAAKRAHTEGAGTAALAIAALRATREAMVKADSQSLPCLKGVPLAGERIGDHIYDGVEEAAIFPGDLPADPSAALDAARIATSASFQLIRFEPPRLKPKGSDVATPALPHIRLDRALDFLLAEDLA